MSKANKTLTASIVSPPSIGASSGTTGTYSYYRVGHNSGAKNVDAVWKFTTPTGGVVTDLVWSFVWNNTAAGTGWSGSFTYSFTISTSSASGTLASGVKTVTATVNGASGTVKVTFTGLTLKANTVYYLRANHSAGTLSTMKAAAASQSIVCTVMTPELVRSTVTGYGSDTENYTVLAWVDDAVNVRIPTWTLTQPTDGSSTQDDIVWHTLYYYSDYGLTSPWEVDGLTYNYGYEVRRDSHNNEYGTYISQLYANRGYGDIYLRRSYYAYYTQNLYFKDSDEAETDLFTPRSINWGDALGELPTPTRKGYKFVGWSTEKVSEEEVSEEVKTVDSSTLLYKTNGFELVNTSEVQPPCKLYAVWKRSGVRRIYTDGEWKQSKRYRYVDGEWKLAIRHIYTNGQWKIGT